MKVKYYSRAIQLFIHHPSVLKSADRKENNFMKNIIAILAVCFIIFASSVLSASDIPVRCDYPPLLKADEASGYKFIMSTVYDSCLNLEKLIEERKIPVQTSTQNVKKMNEIWSTMTPGDKKRIIKKTGKNPVIDMICIERYFFNTKADALIFWKHYLSKMEMRPFGIEPYQKGTYSKSAIGEMCWAKKESRNNNLSKLLEANPGFFKHHRTIVFIKGNILARVMVYRTPADAKGEVDPLFAEKIAKIIEERLDN